MVRVIFALMLQYVLHQGGSDWLGSDDIPLDGFSWRGGCERDTTGILLWSEVFLTDLPSGEKVTLKKCQSIMINER